MSSPGPGVPPQPDPGAGVARDDGTAADGYEYSEYAEPDGRAVTFEAEPSLGELFGELTTSSANSSARRWSWRGSSSRRRPAVPAGPARCSAALPPPGTWHSPCWPSPPPGAWPRWIEPGWAFLVVGLAVGAVAAVLAVTGRNRLREVSPLPDQTVETLKEDARWARAQVT